MIPHWSRWPWQQHRPWEPPPEAARLVARQGEIEARVRRLEQEAEVKRHVGRTERDRRPG